MSSWQSNPCLAIGKPLDESLLREAREFIPQLVSLAAATSLKHFRAKLDVENKASAGFDPVTIADRETEDVLRAAIMQRFPAHGIAGEERAAHRGDAATCWVIDPIDGTKAYVCGLPTWSTLIGLCVDGAPILGAMSQPLVGEYFIGGQGQAWNVTAAGRVALSTSKCATLDNASLFATSLDMFERDSELAQFERLSRRAKMTRFGVDSYAYCLLAAGFVDVVAEAGLGFYDVAALIPIIEAAGGVVSDWNGNPVRGGGAVLAAASPELHRAALEVLNG